MTAWQGIPLERMQAAGEGVNACNPEWGPQTSSIPNSGSARKPIGNAEPQCVHICSLMGSLGGHMYKKF